LFPAIPYYNHQLSVQVMKERIRLYLYFFLPTADCQKLSTIPPPA
jgi:hypothetical protein